MKNIGLVRIGVDSWDRPVYKDQTGQLWKDINLGAGVPELYSACNNDFDGEPDMPIEMTYPDFYE